MVAGRRPGNGSGALGDSLSRLLNELELLPSLLSFRVNVRRWVLVGLKSKQLFSLSFFLLLLPKPLLLLHRFYWKPLAIFVLLEEPLENKMLGVICNDLLTLELSPAFLEFSLHLRISLQFELDLQLLGCLLLFLIFNLLLGPSPFRRGLEELVRGAFGGADCIALHEDLGDLRVELDVHVLLLLDLVVPLFDESVNPVAELHFQLGVDDVDEVLSWELLNLYESVRQVHHHERKVLSKLNELIHGEVIVLRNAQVLHVFAFDVLFGSRSKILQVVHCYQVRVREISTPLMA